VRSIPGSAYLLRRRRMGRRAGRTRRVLPLALWPRGSGGLAQARARSAAITRTPAPTRPSAAMPPGSWPHLSANECGPDLRQRL